MRNLDAIEFVAFFDDDSVLRSDYLQNAVAFLDCHSDVVALTGRVLLDGASAGEISLSESVKAIELTAGEALSGEWRSTRELYGCNLVVRLKVAIELGFDERLPLYSWLEDHDFARRCLRFGTLAKVRDCVIVHRGAASGGRQAHERFGYSQVMNPVYLWRKGSFPARLALQQIARPVLKNLAYSMVGSSRHWRRERLAGNGRAALDAVRGRITPERIVSL